MAYKVTIKTIVSDGTNIFTEAEIFDGVGKTFPLIRPAFRVGTTASVIDTYFQAVADAAPVLDASIAALAGKTYTGV